MAERLERCETCRWWDFLGHDEEYGIETGRCLRNPPTFPPKDVLDYWFGDIDPNKIGMGMWPSTQGHDFCGEWTPEPEAG